MKDAVNPDGKISEAGKKAFALLFPGSVESSPTGGTTTRKEAPKPKPLRLITLAEIEELGLQTPCDACRNGCCGGTEIEVLTLEGVKMAAACRPTNRSGLVQLPQRFEEYFDPDKLYCQQAKDGEDAVKIELGERTKIVAKSRKVGQV